MPLRHLKLCLPPVLAAILVSFVAGCKRRTPPPVPEVYTEMMRDPDFRAKIDAQRVGQKKILSARAQEVERMESLVAEARKALPAGATDEAVKAELEGHPERYPEWKTLFDRVTVLNREYEANLAATRELARARMAQEVRDVAAVKAGKARAKPVSGTRAN